MIVKIKCDQCKDVYKFKVNSIKQAKKYKKALSCTCMKCMSTNEVDLEKINGKSAILAW